MFANIFDAAASSAFRTTTAVMGYAATWVPQAFPLTTHTHQVHFSDPSEAGHKNELEKVDYTGREPWIEYFEGDFPGLMNSANGGGEEEIKVRLTINPAVWVTYGVKTVIPIHDGKCYKAILVIQEE